MTFHFAFLAKTADDARELTEKANAPQQVKDLIYLAVQGLVSTGHAFSAIRVSAQGHLCDGPKSSDMSSIMVYVSPVI